MSTATASPRALKKLCDTGFPPAGTVGYIALLKADLQLNLSFSAAPGTEIFTTAFSHGLTTGSRFRVAGGVAPSPLLQTQDYYAIVLSPTTLKAALTLAETQSGTAINLTDAGSGALVINEQQLTGDDPITVLLAKELTHPNWTSRAALTDLGTSTIVGVNAEKPPKAIAVQNTSTTPLTYKHVLVLFGSTVSSAIGSAVGIESDFMTTEPTPQAINQGETKSIVLKLRVLPA
jgi:hypothetical protein